MGGCTTHLRGCSISQLLLVLLLSCDLQLGSSEPLVTCPSVEALRNGSWAKPPLAPCPHGLPNHQYGGSFRDGLLVFVSSTGNLSNSTISADGLTKIWNSKGTVDVGVVFLPLNESKVINKSCNGLILLDRNCEHSGAIVLIC
jgi:hypothetical protein